MAWIVASRGRAFQRKGVYHPTNEYDYEGRYEDYSDAIEERDRLRSQFKDYEYEVFSESEWNDRFK